MLSYLTTSAVATLAQFGPVLAEGNKLKSSMAWGLVLLLVVLGMLVTLQPVKREKELKGRKE